LIELYDIHKQVLNNSGCDFEIRDKMNTLTVKVSKTMEGFIGQCTENPQFIVNTKTKADIPEKIKTAIFGYVKAFPEETKKIVSDGNLDFKIKLI
jgi:hypothetical protein